MPQLPYTVSSTLLCIYCYRNVHTHEKGFWMPQGPQLDLGTGALTLVFCSKCEEEGNFRNLLPEKMKRKNVISDLSSQWLSIYPELKEIVIAHQREENGIMHVFFTNMPSINKSSTIPVLKVSSIKHHFDFPCTMKTIFEGRLIEPALGFM